MKKICIILFLSFPLALQASGLISPSEALATKPIPNQKPQLVYNKAQDINTPKMRNGQYMRTGIVKSNTTANKQQYAFGEYIDKATRARSIVIEESEIATAPVYKVISGCSNARIGYTKIKNRAIALYPFNPVLANLDAYSKQLIGDMLEWASGENENK